MSSYWDQDWDRAPAPITFDPTVGVEKRKTEMTKLNLTDTETKDLRLDLLKIASGLPHLASEQIVGLAAKMEAFVVGEKEEAND